MSRLSAVGNAVSAAPSVAPTSATAPMIMAGGADRNMVKRAQKLYEVSRKKLAVARKMRLKLLREYVGRHYLGMMNEQAKADPMNFFFRAVWSIVPAIVPSNQEVGVGTQNLMLREFAATFGLALNHLAKRTDRRLLLRRLVVEAVFSVGIAKQGLTFGGEVDIGGILHDVGEPFADLVSFDDYFVDPQARHREEAWLEGDKTLLPLEYVKSCGLYENFDKLQAYACDHKGGGRAQDLSRGEANLNEIDELVPQVELLDAYLPQENLMITMPIDEGQGTDPLRIVEWEGPRRGPYEHLYFHLVPDNIMPLSPGSIWYDLHTMINEEARRLKREAGRRKTITAFTPAATEDAERIKDAADGEAVAVQDVNAIKQYEFGGASDAGYKHMQFLKGMFSYISGNADLVGGLGTPNADTATEASILQGNSQVGIKDMRDEVNFFSKRLYEKDAWYLWSDPLINMPLARRMPDGLETQVYFNSDAREGDFLDYQFDIVTNSAETMDPAIRVKRMQDLVMGFVLPSAQIAMAQGDVPNIKQIAKDLGEVLGVKGVDQWFTSQQPSAPSPQMLMMASLPPGKGVVAGPGNPMNPDTPQLTNPAMVASSANGKPGNELNNSGKAY